MENLLVWHRINVFKLECQHRDSCPLGSHKFDFDGLPISVVDVQDCANVSRVLAPRGLRMGRDKHRSVLSRVKYPNGADRL